MKTDTGPSFLHLLWGETYALLRDAGAQAQLLWFPLLAGLLVAAIFYPGVARELPIAVVDADRTTTSRTLIRELEANAGIRVAETSGTAFDGWEALRDRRVYGVVLIPGGFERSVHRGPPEPVTFYVNTQFLLIGNMLQSEVMATVMEFSARRSAGSLLARGVPVAGLEGSLQPLPARRSGVGNPYLNYLPFLVAAAVPCLLQIFMVLTGVRLIGREFRLGEHSTWLPLAARRPAAALAARFLPAALVYFGVSLSFSELLFGWLGWPFAGHRGLYLLAQAGLVGASLAMGALLAAATANYRLASSVAAFYTAPALAFSGVTFPLFAMPAVAQAWAHSIPVTAFLRLQIEQGFRGSPLVASLPELGILFGFAALGGLLALFLVARKAEDPRCHGRL
ncbi:MAG: ABC transporter permease [Puniceicoccaceae bacterium]|nr:MAG: ABC transporter permease [Puniceicoccaceae bacterium]